MTKFYSLALCAALGIASQAQAAGIFSRSGPDERVPSGWELGVGIGSHVHTETFQDVNFFDTSSTSYKLFTGYRFNRYFTVEAAYLDGGDGTETYVDDLGVTVLSIESNTRGFQGSVLGSLPLGDSAFSVFGRIGVLDWKQDVTTQDFVLQTTAEGTADGNDVFWGGGLMAALDNALLRLEYEYVEFDSDEADFGAKSEVISLSVAWIF